MFILSNETSGLHSGKKLIYLVRNVQIFQKIQEPPQNYRCQNSDIKQVPYYTDDPQILGATVQNSVTQETWYSGFVHPCIR